MDEDLSIPGSFPAGRHDDIPFQSWAAVGRDILSVLQHTTAKAPFLNRTQSRKANTNTIGGEREVNSTAILCANDVEPSTLHKRESQHSASSNNGDLRHKVQYDPPSDEIETTEQDIRSITNISDRRRPVIVVEQVSTPDFPIDESGTKEPLVETQDLTQDTEFGRLRAEDALHAKRSPNRDCAEAEASEAIPLVKRVFVSNRSLAENKGNLGSPFEDSGASSTYDIRTPGHPPPALTRVIVEDRLLADYLHSRPQSRRQSERTSNASLAANAFTGTTRSLSVGQHEPVQSTEEEEYSRNVSLLQNTVPSQVDLNGPYDTRQEDTPEPSKSLDADSSELDNESKQSLGVSISGARPRRTSHSYGRAVCSRSELSELTEGRTYSAFESVFLDDESTSASETSTALRPCQRPRVLVDREELAHKLQNIQEKTRDNRLPQPGDEPLPLQALPGVEVESESLLTILTRGRKSSSSPRLAVPTASDIRRARTHSTVIHFSASQDDLQVDFLPRQTEDERVVEDIGEKGQTSQASPRRKVGMKEKIKEFMSADARKNRARGRKRKDPNG